MKRILFFLIGLGVCLFSFQLIVTYLNDGFTLKKIKSDEPFNAKWEVNNPPVSTIQELLNQKFYYLGKGSQCYVFESEDHKTVLKFFKHNRYRVPKISSLILYPQFLTALCQKQKEEKEKKRDVLFQSCTIAFEELRDETNLIYLHINKTNTLHQTITLFDRLKRCKILNSDDYAFILQKKGEPLFTYLDSLIKQKKTEEAKEALLQLASLILRRMDKGIADHDAVIEKNSGFVDKKAFFLDIGGFSKENSPLPSSELTHTTAHLLNWLERCDPELALFFKKERLAFF